MAKRELCLKLVGLRAQDPWPQPAAPRFSVESIGLGGHCLDADGAEGSLAMLGSAELSVGALALPSIQRH